MTQDSAPADDGAVTDDEGTTVSAKDVDASVKQASVRTPWPPLRPYPDHPSNRTLTRPRTHSAQRSTTRSSRKALPARPLRRRPSTSRRRSPAARNRALCRTRVTRAQPTWAMPAKSPRSVYVPIVRFRRKLTRAYAVQAGAQGGSAGLSVDTTQRQRIYRMYLTVYLHGCWRRLLLLGTPRSCEPMEMWHLWRCDETRNEASCTCGLRSMQVRLSLPLIHPFLSGRTSTESSKYHRLVRLIAATQLCGALYGTLTTES